MADYNDILNMRLGEFKEIPPLPVGTYVATVVSIPKIDKFGQKQNMGFEVQFKLTAPMQDVDQEQLAAAGGLPVDPMSYTFWLTPKAAIILQRFLVDVMGVENGTSIPDAGQQIVGSSCLVVVEHSDPKRSKTGRVFSQINGFAKID